MTAVTTNLLARFHALAPEAEPPERREAAGKYDGLPKEILEITGGVAAAVGGVTAAFSVGPVAALALPTAAVAAIPLAVSGALAGGGLHAVALLAEAITRATDYETLNKGCAFFGDDNGVGALSDEAGKKSAEMKPAKPKGAD
jgi:hypothetical protein